MRQSKSLGQGGQTLSFLKVLFAPKSGCFTPSSSSRMPVSCQSSTLMVLWRRPRFHGKELRAKNGMQATGSCVNLSGLRVDSATRLTSLALQFASISNRIKVLPQLAFWCVSCYLHGKDSYQYCGSGRHSISGGPAGAGGAEAGPCRTDMGEMDSGPARSGPAIALPGGHHFACGNARAAAAHKA